MTNLDNLRLGLFEEVLPPIMQMSPVVEHTVLHQGLAMLFANTVGTPLLTRLDNASLMLLLGQMAKAGITNIVCNRPTNSIDSDLFRAMFEIPGTDYHFGRESGAIKVRQHAAVGSSFLYLRDQIMQGVDENNDLILVSSQDPNQSHSTNGSMLFSYGREFNAKTGLLLGSFTGGNIVPTKNHILTMKQTVVDNMNFLHARGTDIPPEAVIEYLTKLFGGKNLQVLDGPILLGIPQIIYHLDLFLNGLQGLDGKEYILITSLRKTEEVLEAAGILKNGTLDHAGFRKWIFANEYSACKPEAVEQKLSEHIRQLAKVGGLQGQPLQQIRHLLKNLYYAEHQSLASIVKHSALYFDERNSSQVKMLTDKVIEKLLSLGFTADQIIEVPGLLFPDSATPKYPDEQRLVTYRFPAPYYTPANGVQYQQQGKEPRYITVGGIRQLDEITRKIIKERTGLKSIQLSSLLPYGQSAAGLRCLAIPIKDNQK